MMDPNVIEEKIREYERFIEDNLKRDLKEIEQVLTKKNEAFKDWEDVKQVVKTVQEFKEKDRDMLVRVDIGNNIETFGEVTDYERTYIDVGLGIILEMDCEEASKYSDIRLKALKKEIDHYRKLAVNVKVHIKLVLLALNELQATLKPLS